MWKATWINGFYPAPLHLFCKLHGFWRKLFSLKVDNMTVVPKKKRLGEMIICSLFCGLTALYHLPFKPTHCISASPFT